jgi:superfamily II DNA/RNA helicase
MRPAPAQLEVRPRVLDTAVVPDSEGIQAIFRFLVENEKRNRVIARDAIDAYREKRNILILTERTEHLRHLQALLEPAIGNLITLHGRMKKTERAENIERLASMDEQEAKIILATGRLIGEGFDYPPLDTLLFAMPISWKGTLQQRSASTTTSTRTTRSWRGCGRSGRTGISGNRVSDRGRQKGRNALRMGSQALKTKNILITPNANVC